MQRVGLDLTLFESTWILSAIDYYSRFVWKINWLMPHVEGILPKGPYLPCVSMAGRALMAEYHRCVKIIKLPLVVTCDLVCGARFESHILDSWVRPANLMRLSNSQSRPATRDSGPPNASVTSHSQAPYGLFPGCSQAVLNKNRTSTHGSRAAPYEFCLLVRGP